MKHILTTIGLSLAVHVAAAQSPASEVAKLVAGDASPLDELGTSVAVDGGLGVVGVPHDSNAGSAYVFARAPATGQWGEVKKLLPSVPVEFGRFGAAVAIQGDTVFVGQPRHDGIVYVFERNQGGPDNWGEAQQLTVATVQAQLGVGLAMDGDTALLGAVRTEAYVFARDASGWSEVKRLVPSNVSSSSFFGSKVSLSGDLAAVGALFDDLPISDAGSAFVFARDHGGPDNWGEVKKLGASDATTNDLFGSSVHLVGERLAVGASSVGSTGQLEGIGAAYVFERDAGGPDNWGEVTRVDPSDGQPVAGFGWQFGASVWLAGDTLLVGAYGDTHSGPDTGSVYAFARDLGGPDEWGEVGRLTASDAQERDWFGFAIAVDGTTALIGAPKEDDGGNRAGAAYVFDLDRLSFTSFCDAADGALAACPCGNAGDPDSGCDIPQSTGGVRLDVIARTTSPNRATMTGTGFPMGAPTALVIRSNALDAAAPVVFGDGVRCVSTSPLVRLAAAAASGGASVHVVGHGAMAAPGPHYYQLWFRSTPSPFCDPIAAFNLSNGRTLTW